MMIPMYLSVLTFYSYCLLESVTLVMLGNGKKTCPRIDIRQSSHVHYIIAWSFFHFLLLSLFFHFIRYFISWMIITINVIEKFYIHATLSINMNLFTLIILREDQFYNSSWIYFLYLRWSLQSYFKDIYWLQRLY